MSHDAVFAVSRAGLDYERARLEAAARAIAIADTPISPGSTTRKAEGANFGTAVGAPEAQRLVHDPTNPMADSHGMVHYPAIDMAQAMTTLISASRAYEANVRAFNVLQGIELDALKIGGTQS